MYEMLVVIREVQVTSVSWFMLILFLAISDPEFGRLVLLERGIFAAESESMMISLVLLDVILEVILDVMQLLYLI